MKRIPKKFQPGDIVRYHDGRIDWEVKGVIDMTPRKNGADRPFYYILESGMSGRRVTAWPDEVRPWKPGER